MSRQLGAQRRAVAPDGPVDLTVAAERRRGCVGQPFGLLEGPPAADPEQGVGRHGGVADEGEAGRGPAAPQVGVIDEADDLRRLVGGIEAGVFRHA